MRCPFCGSKEDKVVDTRSCADDTQVRRRRECLSCKRRYTTYEQVEEISLRVVKKDGTRVPFERGKVLGGLLKACEKRPVSMEALEAVVRDVEAAALQQFDKEVPSRFIGEQVMRHLKALDQVGFVRFASVYREFKDVDEFTREIRTLSPKTESSVRPT